MLAPALLAGVIAGFVDILLGQKSIGHLALLAGGTAIMVYVVGSLIELGSKRDP